MARPRTPALMNLSKSAETSVVLFYLLLLTSWPVSLLVASEACPACVVRTTCPARHHVHYQDLQRLVFDTDQLQPHLPKHSGLCYFNVEAPP